MQKPTSLDRMLAITETLMCNRSITPTKPFCKKDAVKNGVVQTILQKLFQ